VDSAEDAEIDVTELDRRLPREDAEDDDRLFKVRFGCLLHFFSKFSHTRRHTFFSVLQSRTMLFGGLFWTYTLIVHILEGVTPLLHQRG
jgi:hypothetical protein